MDLYVQNKPPAQKKKHNLSLLIEYLTLKKTTTKILTQIY